MSKVDSKDQLLVKICVASSTIFSESTDSSNSDTHSSLDLMLVSQCDACDAEKIVHEPSMLCRGFFFDNTLRQF